MAKNPFVSAPLLVSARMCPQGILAFIYGYRGQKIVNAMDSIRRLRLLRVRAD
jgi:hypothetical protein